MNIPKRVCLIGPNIVTASFTLPDKTVKEFKRGDTYITSDPEELDFFSKQKGIAIVDLKITPLIEYFAQVTIPTVDNVVITPVIADEFKWDTEAEQRVIKKLEELGYVITKANIESEAKTATVKIETPPTPPVPEAKKDSNPVEPPVKRKRSVAKRKPVVKKK